MENTEVSMFSRFQELRSSFSTFYYRSRVVGPKIALKHGIKLVFYGENVAEYGNRIEDNYCPTMDPALFTCFDFNQNNLGNYRIAGLTLKQLTEDYGFSFNDLLPYQSPSLNDIQTANLSVHYMSYYKKWVPQENYYYAVEHTGFQPNPKRRDGSFSRYAGIDDQMKIFTITCKSLNSAWDVVHGMRLRNRSGKLEREEGVSLVRRYDSEPPTEYFDQIIEYLIFLEKSFADY